MKQVYDLDVVAIPPNRPNRRVDYEDVIFTHRSAKEAALISEIADAHASGRPILVGTSSVGGIGTAGRGAGESRNPESDPKRTQR